MRTSWLLIALVCCATLDWVPLGAADGDQANSPAIPPKQADNKQPSTDLHGDPLPAGALARMGTVRFRASSTWIGFAPGDTTLLTAGGESLSAWEVSTGKELYHCPCEGGKLSFALAPDGKTLAVGTHPDDPKTVSIYLRDVATGRAVQECRGHTEWVRSLAFAADGRTLVSGSHDKTVRFWDVATGKELARFDEPDMVLAVALAHDGKTLATTNFHSPDTKWTVRLRDAASGQEQHRFQADVPVFHLAFSPDGKILVALAPHNGGEPASTIHLWDVATGKVRQISGQPAFLYSAAFSPDSKTLATGSDQGIVLWDVATAKERGRPGGQYAFPPGVTFSGDGKLLAWVGNGTIRLWDVAAGKEVRAPAEGHRGGVEKLVFLPDGKTLASAGRDRTLRLWEVPTGRSVRQHPLPARTTDSSGWFAPDGSTLVWGDGKRIVQLDVATGKPVRSIDFPDDVYYFAVAADGKLLAAYGGDQTLRLVDRTTGKVVRDLSKRGAQEVSHLAFAPDARTLAVRLEEEGNTVGLLDTTTGERRALLPYQKRVVTFAFSPDSKTLSVSLGDNLVVLVEVATGAELLALRMPEQAAQLVSSPNGKLLAVGTAAGTIHLWELATGQEVSRAEGHRGAVSCLAFSADGRRLASGGHDTTVLTWDVFNLTGEPPAAENLSAKELAALWADLAGADSARAYRAIRALVAAPEQSVPFLRQQLRPVAAPDPKRLARLIADLDADEFAVREQATRELEKLGPLTGPALRQALDGQPSPEVRLRVERLLQRAHKLLLTAEELRVWRAMEVLAHVATSEARRALEELARGAAGARPTEEAKAALERLGKRQDVRP